MTDVITAVLQLPAPIAAAVTLEAGEIITAQIVQPAAPIAAAITVAGPAGPAGPTGATGPAGPTGPAGTGGSGAVASVFGRTGTVTAQTGDYTAAQVGADTATARDTAISTATAPLATSSALTTGLAGKQPTSSDLTAIAGLDSSTAGAIASDGAGWVKKTYAQFKTALGLVKADVGLGNVDNTSDVNKPVSTAQATADALALKIASNLSDLNNPATARSNLGVPAGSGTSTGTNTGDQTLPTTLPPSGAAGGDLTGTYPNPGVGKLNGTSLAALGTGLVKNTTGTGVPSIAAAADVPTVAAGSTGPLAATDSTTTNARTPTAHASTHAPGAADDLTTALSASAVPVALGTAATGSGTGFARQGHVHPTTGLILTGDSRLTDARTPTAHAASHASGGSDAVTIAESQVTNLTTDLAAKVPTTRTVAGHALSADVTLVKADVGLGSVDNTADTAKPVSTAQQAALDALVIPKLVMPITCQSAPLATATSTATSGNARFARVIIPKAGFLRDVSYYVSTQSGNVRLMVYDTGDASAGSYTSIWTSASTAVSGGGGWQSIDPGASTLSVTAGQQVMFGLVFDNSTAVYGRSTGFTGNPAAQLPSAFMVAAGGALPKLSAQATVTFGSLGAISEASMTAVNTTPVIIARFQ